MNNTYITYIIFIFQTLFKNVLKSFKVLFDKVAKKIYYLLINILEDFLKKFAYKVNTDKLHFLLTKNILILICSNYSYAT